MCVHSHGNDVTGAVTGRQEIENSEASKRRIQEWPSSFRSAVSGSKVEILCNRTIMVPGYKSARRANGIEGVALHIILANRLLARLR